MADAESMPVVVYGCVVAVYMIAIAIRLHARRFKIAVRVRQLPMVIASTVVSVSLIGVVILRTVGVTKAVCNVVMDMVQYLLLQGMWVAIWSFRVLSMQHLVSKKYSWTSMCCVGAVFIVIIPILCLQMMHVLSPACFGVTQASVACLVAISVSHLCVLVFANIKYAQLPPPFGIGKAAHVLVCATLVCLLAILIGVGHPSVADLSVRIVTPLVLFTVLACYQTVQCAPVVSVFLSLQDEMMQSGYEITNATTDEDAAELLSMDQFDNYIRWKLPRVYAMRAALSLYMTSCVTSDVTVRAIIDTYFKDTKLCGTMRNDKCISNDIGTTATMRIIGPNDAFGISTWLHNIERFLRENKFHEQYIQSCDALFHPFDEQQQQQQQQERSVDGDDEEEVRMPLQRRELKSISVLERPRRPQRPAVMPAVIGRRLASRDSERHNISLTRRFEPDLNFVEVVSQSSAFDDVGGCLV